MSAVPQSPAVVAALVGVAFLAGVGITAIGPGGVFTTAAVYALTPTPPATVAGTMSATFVATGLLGAAGYVRSGELRGQAGTATAAALGLAGAVGAVVGAVLNEALSSNQFGGLLGAFLAVAGLSILGGERLGDPTGRTLDPTSARGRIAVGGVGLGTGVLGGMLGVGGPVLAVPALVLLGVPMLLAVGSSQVLSVLLAGSAAATYLLKGAVSLPLAALVGLPQLVGVVVGWRIAQRVNADRLKPVLGVALLVVAAVVAA